MNKDPIACDSYNTLPQCPAGKSQCDIISQLGALCEEVALLSKQVRTDTLTGLFNFRHFIEVLALEMERTLRTGQSTALIMMDLDNFKNVNDTWGHDVGNQALATAAQLLRQTIRQLDIPCRYGGEEFAIILPSVDVIVGIQVAERIRANIEAMPVLADGKDINLTVSLGMALFDGGQNETAENFIKRADHYLYQAKESGRNRVCHEIKQLDNIRLAVSQEEKDALFTGIDGGSES